jgi:hypothetical protein
MNMLSLSSSASRMMGTSSLFVVLPFRIPTRQKNAEVTRLLIFRNAREVHHQSPLRNSLTLEETT